MEIKEMVKGVERETDHLSLVPLSVPPHRFPPMMLVLYCLLLLLLLLSMMMIG